MRLPTKFGSFGGVFVAELLVPVLEEIEQGWIEAKGDASFRARLSELSRTYAGRPTPLHHAAKISRALGIEVLLKREDLLHGGAHKTNNALGQGLLAQRLGKTRLIAETGAGQHGVATAMVGGLLGMPVEIFMGAVDIARQRPNVERMQLFGAKVTPVESGSRSLKDAINEALRAWTARAEDTFYLFGTAAGPHPFPTIVGELQRVIGDEARAQMLGAYGALPDQVIACVGGGSNAIGAFTAFVGDPGVELVGVEPGGHGIDTAAHGATLARGRAGIVHGSRSYVLQDREGQIHEAHSISAGLDYPGVGPEHAFLKESGRARYTHATDDQALEAYRWLARTEGILPALESAHALAALRREAEEGRTTRGARVVVSLSGRGDKDLAHATASLAALDALRGGGS